MATDATRADKLAALAEWRSAMIAIDAAEDRLRKTIGYAPESSLNQAISALQLAATRAVATATGDDGGWCEYYWLERALGRKKDTPCPVEINGKRFPLRTPAHLLRCIEFERDVP